MPCGAQAVRKVDVDATAAAAAAGAQGGAAPKPKRNPMEDLKREILIMSHMRHNNIVALNEASAAGWLGRSGTCCTSGAKQARELRFRAVSRTASSLLWRWSVAARVER